MSDNAPKNFLLPADFGQAILNYLVERPYREVAPLVNGMMALKTEGSEEAGGLQPEEVELEEEKQEEAEEEKAAGE